MNFTDGSLSMDGSLSNELLYDDNLCENITNHWLYFIFTGYLLPIISPNVRNYFKEFHRIKKCLLWHEMCFGRVMEQ